MSLVLGAGAYCNWNKVLPVLNALGFNDGQASVVGLKLTQDALIQALANQHSVVLESNDHLHELSQILESHPNQRVILLYSTLEDVLVNIVNSEEAVDEALGVWVNSLMMLQELYRKHRKQTLLFDLQSVLAEPKLFLEACNSEWGCTVAEIDWTSEVRQENAWSQILATQLLTHNTKLNQVVQYTKVMTWPLGGHENRREDAVEGVMTLLRHLQSHTSLLKNSNQLTLEKESLEEDKLKTLEENELILEQLFCVQEELEKQILESQKGQQEFTALLSDYTRLEVDKNKLNTEVTTLKAQHKNFQEKIKLSDKMLLQSELDKKNSNTKINSLKDQLKDFEEKNKLSEKTFTQFKIQQKELAHENQLLLGQVTILQDKLETIKSEKATTEHLQEEVLSKLEAMPESSPSKVGQIQSSESEQINQPKSFFDRRRAKKARLNNLIRDKERAEAIEKSAWFNATWYLEQYPDIAADPVQSVNPALHYMRIGGFEGRKPSKNFDSVFYLMSNPDVQKMGFNPLWHFLKHGKAEGRKPHP